MPVIDAVERSIKFLTIDKCESRILAKGAFPWCVRVVSLLILRSYYLQDHFLCIYAVKQFLEISSEL